MALATGSYEFLSVVRGHHVFKDIWTPVIDEQLTVKKEDSNKHDPVICPLCCSSRKQL